MEDITDTDLVAFVNEGDQNSFNSLLIRHQPIIRYFGRKYFAPGLMRGDLHQAGCIGLFIACKKYSPYKGMSFSSFARMHIKHHIMNAVLTALRKKQQVLNESLSLDEAPSAQYRRENRYELVPVITPSPEEIYIEQFTKKELFHMLQLHLTALESTAVLGLMDGLAYKEIADLAGVGHKSIDNALKRAKGKLKPLLYSNA